MPAQIHPTAVVHPGAELDDGVVIGPHCVVEDKVFLGAGTRLEAFSLVKPYVRMGRDNIIHSHACVGGEPQDLKFKGEETWVTIGDGNHIREYVTIHRGTAGGGGQTVIGSGCLLMAYVHVAHDCHLSDNVIMANAAMLGGHVHIGRNSAIGGMSGVHQFVNIGEYAFLGAMSGLGQDLPPYMLAAGSRASLHSLNVVALRRLGVSRETMSAMNQTYKRVYRSETPRDEAMASVEKDFSHIPEVMSVVAFIRASKRGTVTPDKTGNGAPEPTM